MGLEKGWHLLAVLLLLAATGLKAGRAELLELRELAAEVVLRFIILVACIFASSTLER